MIQMKKTDTQRMYDRAFSFLEKKFGPDFSFSFEEGIELFKQATEIAQSLPASLRGEFLIRGSNRQGLPKGSHKVIGTSNRKRSPMKTFDPPRPKKKVSNGEKVRAIVNRSGGEGATSVQVAEVLGIGSTDACKLLNTLYNNGEIRRLKAKAGSGHVKYRYLAKKVRAAA
jgi:hypothetical protein